MMRDSQGRFVNDRTFAAEVLLEVAVEEAQVAIRGWRPAEPMPGYDVASEWTPYDHPATVRMLAEATRSADLLLKGVER